MGLNLTIEEIRYILKCMNQYKYGENPIHDDLWDNLYESLEEYEGEFEHEI